MALPSNDPDQLSLSMAEASLSLLVALRKAGSKAFRPLGFTTMEAMVVIFIGAGVTKPTDLARFLGVAFPGLSAVTTKMAYSGFLTKDTFEGDHRQVQLQLTSQGKRACRDIRAAWAAHSPIDTSSLTDEEISTFVKVSEKLLRLN